MATLEEMLAKANAKDNPANQETPLLDKAMAALNNDELSILEKRALIDELASRAKGYEAECFADIYSSLVSSASLDEIQQMNEQGNT